jgi:hypothetical protein
MTAVLEIVGVVALAAAVVFLLSRFPDTRRAFGEDVDNALHRGSLRALWFFVAIAAVALAVLWLLG